MAHKTLIGGTAYKIKGGRDLIGGTGYAKKSGKVLIDGTVYEIGFSSGQTWRMNDKVYAPEYGHDVNETINFTTSSGATFTGIEIPWGFGSINVIYKKGNMNDIAYGNSVWAKGYNIVTFEEPPTGDLLAWLQANAVQQ